jgi:hypothetical protein
MLRQFEISGHLSFRCIAPRPSFGASRHLLLEGEGFSALCTFSLREKVARVSRPDEGLRKSGLR